MNTTYSALGRAALLIALCISSAACPGSDKATGPEVVKPDPTSGQDRTAPAVRSTRPARDASNVAVTGVIEVEFSEPMDSASVAAAFKVDGVSGSVSVSGMTARFLPTVALRAGIRHAARVTTQARDTAGNALAQEYSWGFTTSAAPAAFAPLPLSSGKAWRYDVADTTSICTRSGCSASKFAGYSFVHVEKEVAWEGRTAWRVMVYRLPSMASGAEAGLSVRTEHIAQAVDALLRWKTGAWRTVLPATGSSFPTGAFLLIDGPTHAGTSTRAASSVTVPAGTYNTTRVQHEFKETGQFATKDIFETRTEHYAQNVGLVLGSWSYSKDDNDPAGIDETRRGRIALSSLFSRMPSFTEEREPNDASSSADVIPGELNIFSGSAHINDAGAILRDVDVGCSQVCVHPNNNGQVRMQDWHRISIPHEQNVRIEMAYEAAFPGAVRGNDLDLYLFRETSAGLRFVASSVNDQGKAELITMRLAAGSYYLAVQAWDTPAAAVRYWLLSAIDTK